MVGETDVWRPLPGGLAGWSAEYPIHGWSARTTVVRLSSDDLLVINPGKPIAEQVRRQLSAFGRVTHLLAPSRLHYLGVASWRDSFGALPVLAAASAHARLAKRLGFEPAPLSSLPTGADLVVPDGVKTGETWLVLRTADSVAWIVCDAFFHLPHTPRNPAGVFLRLSGTTPGLRIGNTFKWGHLQDRAAYRDWILRRIDEDRPSILIPAHGEPIEDAELASRLRALVEKRLG